MAAIDTDDNENEPEWRQRAVSRSLTAARSRAEVRIQRFLDAAFELIDEKGTTEFTIQEVIDRSKEILFNLEEGELGESGQPKLARRNVRKLKIDPRQMDLFGG